MDRELLPCLCVSSRDHSSALRIRFILISYSAYASKLVLPDVTERY